MSEPSASASSDGGRLGINIASLFVYRPVMTLLVMLGILTFGVASYR